MLSFLTGSSQTTQLKEPNQQNLKTQIKKALNKVCQLCNNYSVEELTYGQDVQPTLTCSKCQLKAVGNEPSRLATNIMTTQTFSENLAKELSEYAANKMRPVNTQKANSESCVELSKKANDQIQETKGIYKKFKAATSDKLTDLINASEASNKIQVFEKMSELTQSKKLDQIGNGDVLIKACLVTDALHFVDEANLEESNNRMNQHINRINEITDIDLSELNELISYVKKVHI